MAKAPGKHFRKVITLADAVKTFSDPETAENGSPNAVGRTEFAAPIAAQ